MDTFSYGGFTGRGMAEGYTPGKLLDERGKAHRLEGRRPCLAAGRVSDRTRRWKGFVLLPAARGQRFDQIVRVEADAPPPLDECGQPPTRPQLARKTEGRWRLGQPTQHGPFLSVG